MREDAQSEAAGVTFAGDICHNSSLFQPLPSLFPNTGAGAPLDYKCPAWLVSGSLLIKPCLPRSLSACRNEDTAALTGAPRTGLFPLDNAICQPQQAGAIPRQSEHNKCLWLLLTKLKFVISRRSARTNECLRLIAPSLLTDIS